MERKNTISSNHKRTRCQNWARCVGYLRPTSLWNAGKQSEFSDRKVFKVDKV